MHGYALIFCFSVPGAEKAQLRMVRILDKLCLPLNGGNVGPNLPALRAAHSAQGRLMCD